MTMTLDELKEAVADICAGCDSERSQFTNADLGDAIDAAIRERDRLRGDVDGLRDCVERAKAELAALKARIAEACRADGQRVFDLLGLPIEFDGTLALVRVEE